MKKVIRLTESDLTRIIKRVIMEQQSSVSNKSVIAIYNEIIDAVEGWGTNPDKVLSAIKKLKDQNEFKYLLTLFKDKKINSVENRIIIFNSNIEHTGTSTTNANYRMVLNLNYF